ncbi:TOX high mobility group box family member 4 [Python bivittatus]|uniref:TOX high mobility group box family member 4 n=1 Tax=Python bivittatus TaxID=176946 RepID=A0A9F2QWY3_PYTBI|nr:TOX high mobility group box family member 4 [Python bivittatus]
MEFPGGNENYLAITGTTHPFLSGAETFHTPSLGDEEFEIPPIALDADPSLAVSDVVGHFEDLGDPVTAPDATFSAQYGVQALDIPVGISHGLMEQGGGLLSGGLAMDLDHPMGTQYSANPPVTIDVPMTDISTGLMGHGQLTTIDQSELSSQLGLSLGGSSILPPAAQSPEERLTPTPSPTNSVHEEETEEIRRQVSVAKPTPPASAAPAPVAAPAAVLDMGKKQKPAKKQKKKKDPNEPQKPVSAYALFFRDTQAAIKGQNPKATFGEVSKIVASMWDSLGEEQKQVYKRKTEAAKKEYLKALAAYRDNQECQTTVETVELDPISSPSEQPAPAVESASPPAPMPPTPPALESPPPPPPPAIVPTQPTVVVTSSAGPQSAGQTSITKIIIPKQMLPSSLAVSSQGGVVTVIPATMVTSRGPPLQQKVRLNLQQPPPPLQIKILPPPALQIQPIALRTEDGSPERPNTELQASPEPIDVVPEVESPTQMHVELVSESPMAMSPRPRCIRAGCDNPPVANSDWDNEYCSNECVVKHCRDVFLAWLASRNSNNNVVFVK